jgi:hypothetical protein
VWHELVGPFAYAAGTAGTVTVPSSAVVTKIITHASTGSATCAIFGGTPIPIINGAPPTVFDFMHDCVKPQGNSTAAQIVFANTDSYYVEYISPGGS